jgi:outer membrane protein TolC
LYISISTASASGRSAYGAAPAARRRKRWPGIEGTGVPHSIDNTRTPMMRFTACTALVATFALAVGGCMVGPDYVRPAAPTPAAYKEAPGWKVAQPADDAPRGNWWEAYGDPELNALEAQIDISNQTLKAAEARMREALAATQGARAALFPLVNANGAALRTSHGTGSSTSANAQSGVNNSYNLALAASWEIDLWGGIRRSVEASDNTAQATAADLAGARLSAQALLAQDFLLLRVEDAQISLLRDTVTTYERSLQLTRNQYAAGIVARGDVAQAESQLKSTQRSSMPCWRARNSSTRSPCLSASRRQN